MKKMLLGLGVVFFVLNVSAMANMAFYEALEEFASKFEPCVATLKCGYTGECEKAIQYDIADYKKFILVCFSEIKEMYGIEKLSENKDIILKSFLLLKLSGRYDEPKIDAIYRLLLPGICMCLFEGPEVFASPYKGRLVSTKN